LQLNDNRNLRDLPNLPDQMPDSYYDRLEGLLAYRHKKRKSAGEMLTCEFAQFHKMAFTFEQIALEAQQEANKVSFEEGKQDSNPRRKRTQSVSLKGSVGRHSLFLDYQKFERSLTGEFVVC
jgi:hypothetical protein